MKGPAVALPLVDELQLDTYLLWHAAKGDLLDGVELDPRNFHRKVTGTAGSLVETGRTTTRGGGRPAMLYTARDAALNPPILRS